MLKSKEETCKNIQEIAVFDREKLDWMLGALGCEEAPLGLFFTGKKPEGHGPDSTRAPDCLMKYIRLARVRREPGWISRQQPGCRGGAIYAGFAEPSDAVARFVTTGFPGREGERYMPAPGSMSRFFKELDPRPAPADYCVVKPLDLFSDEEKPLSIIFFARGELLSGLCQLACFALDDHQAVAFPFGSGCANILSWPLHYARRGQERAVVGGADPSCRPYLETDELSFALPASSFMIMLDAAPHSFLAGGSWVSVRRKIEKSRARWKRQAAPCSPVVASAPLPAQCASS